MSFRVCVLILFLCLACNKPKSDEQAEKLALSSVDSAINALRAEENKPHESGKKPENGHHKPNKLHESKQDTTKEEIANSHINKQTAETAFAKGREHEGNENYATAASFYGQAVAADASFAEAYFRLGLVSGALDKHTQAIEAYQKAIKNNYTNLADCYGNLGYQQLAIKKYEQAKRNFKQALAKKEDAESYAGLAIACYYLKDLGDALNAYRKASEFDADFLKDDVKSAVSLKYLFTDNDMIAINELAKKIKN